MTPSNDPAEGGADAAAHSRETTLRERMLHEHVITTAWRLNSLANFYSVPFFRALEQATGVSRAQYNILLCLAHFPGITAQDIVAISSRPKNSISVAVGQLEESGLIVRRQSRTDSRLIELHLTDFGREAYAELTPLLEQRQSQMLDILTPSERNRLDQLLLKVGLNIPAWEEPELPPSLKRFRSKGGRQTAN